MFSALMVLTFNQAPIVLRYSAHIKPRKRLKQEHLIAMIFISRLIMKFGD